MQLTLRDDLPFTSVKVAYQGLEIEVPDVLVDTGSATTVLAAGIVAMIGIVPEPADIPLYDSRCWWHRGCFRAPYYIAGCWR